MLDVALVNYIGAGWCSLAPAYGLDVPPGASTNGKTLLQLMYRHEPTATQNFLEDAVQTIWADWLDSGMPTSVAVSHLETIPQLIEDNQPTTDTIIAAVAITTATNKLGPAAVNGQARRLSSDIIERARETGFFHYSGTSDGVMFYFLESMYGRLLRAWPIVDSANQHLRNYCETTPWMLAANASPTAPANHTPVAEEEIPLATAMAVEVEGDNWAAGGEDTPNEAFDNIPAADESDEPSIDRAMASVQAALAKRGSAFELNQLQISFFIDTYKDLIRILSDNALPKDEWDAFARNAKQLVAAGEFAQADLALASLEQSLDDALVEEGEAVDNVGKWLARSRSWRGKLSELQFDFRRAARHYEVATKYLPNKNYVDRWTYIERQAQAFSAQNKFHNDPTALDDAIKLCTGFIVVLHDSDQPECQANAKMMLAKVLLTAAERNGQAGQLELAARHLSEAITILDQSKRGIERVNATALLADVLNEMGLALDETKHLEDAVRKYQSLLGTGAHLPAVQQAHLSQGLGVALARLGTRTGKAEFQTLAIETLKKALSVSDERSPSHYLPRAFATLGSALAAQAVRSGDIGDRRESIEAYRTADTLKYLDPHYPGLQSIQTALETMQADHEIADKDAAPNEALPIEDAPDYHGTTDVPVKSRIENHYLTKLRETLREAHFKQASRGNASAPQGKLSA
ncbi:MAG: hypothetical protein AAGB04_20990 [Pseudomonadota bacterium]